jgi:hypothetical protein
MCILLEQSKYIQLPPKIRADESKSSRCIFCKKTSYDSKSVEHIIPESLGNSLHTLPVGVVCDPCNHYFGAKIEGPLLSSPHFKNLRGRQAVVSKKGKIPPYEAFLPGLGKVLLRFDKNSGGKYLYTEDEEDSSKLESYLKINKTGEMRIPMYSPTDKYLLSRFLAKVALEVLTNRVYEYQGWEEQVIDFKDLDEIREYARYGKGIKYWPFHERIIYNENHLWEDAGQTMHEFDLLYTDAQELYSIVCIFGTEYTINLGSPQMDGYEKWLANNNNQSPLYTGKNAED